MAGEWRPILNERPAMVWPVPIDPSGHVGPTRGRAAGPRWRRTGSDLYVPCNVDATHAGQRIAEAFARSRGRGIVTGWASLWLHRAAYFDGLLGDGRTAVPVPLVEGDGRLRSTKEVQVIRCHVADDQTTVRFGIRCTSAELALLHHVAGLKDQWEAVIAVDMAMAAQLTSIRRFTAFLDTMPGVRGVRKARMVLALADERSASPRESRFRLIWQLAAGWPRPLVNCDLLTEDGRFIGRPDLFDPDRGIVGEFAGAVHRDRARHRNDVRREDLFRRAGLEYVEVVGADLHDVQLVVDRMNAAAARAGSQPRRWRLGASPMTLDDVLDERDFMIAFHEGTV